MLDEVLPFRLLEPGQKAVLAELWVQEFLPKGSFLFQTGDGDNRVYILESGSLLFGDSRVGASQFFGERPSLLDTRSLLRLRPQEFT